MGRQRVAEAVVDGVLEASARRRRELPDMVSRRRSDLPDMVSRRRSDLPDMASRSEG